MQRQDSFKAKSSTAKNAGMLVKMLKSKANKKMHD